MSDNLKSLVKKAVIILIIAGLIVVYKIYNLNQYLTLSYLKASRETFLTLYTEHRLLVTAGYMGIYILVTSLSLPGAIVLTLAAGALFGFWLGTLVVSFASTIGATLACSVSRYVLREWIQGKFGDKLSAINRGIEREGKFYLFTLRLIPVFPFFVINLIMGLTAMPLIIFYWVSQLGMLPGTMVYVNAGKQLAEIESLSGILSPGVVFSFALLGLFPLLSKKLVDFYKSGRKRSGR